MKKLLTLTIGILLTTISFSQAILNVEKDMQFTIDGDTVSCEPVYSYATIKYTDTGVIFKFYDLNEMEYVKVKCKFIGFDEENQKSWILECDELGKLRFIHNILASKAKIEFKKDKRIMILN